MARTCVLAVCLLSVFSVAVAPKSLDEKSISTKIGTLRSLPDAERAVLTLELAMEIRSLDASPTKASLASSLANLATEGDFGTKTLQEVTTTLAIALKQSPMQDQQGGPAYAYTQLANLEIYEGMKVDLDSPSFSKAKEIVTKLAAERAMVDFTLTDLSGKSWKLSDLKGKVVLVNFWATWCPPCRKEMPDIQALYDRFKDKGLIVLSLSDETLDKVQPFIKEGKYTFPVLLDPGRKVNTMYKIDGIPKNFVYDRNGKLVAQSIDMRTQGQFLKMLAAAGLKDAD